MFHILKANTHITGSNVNIVKRTFCTTIHFIIMRKSIKHLLTFVLNAVMPAVTKVNWTDMWQSIRRYYRMVATNDSLLRKVSNNMSGYMRICLSPAQCVVWSKQHRNNYILISEGHMGKDIQWNVAVCFNGLVHVQGIKGSDWCKEVAHQALNKWKYNTESETGEKPDLKESLKKEQNMKTEQNVKQSLKTE